VVDAVDAAGPVRTEEEYAGLLARVSAQAADGVRTTLADLLRVLAAWRETDKVLSGRADLPLLPALTDLQAQLARLVHDGFVGEAGAAQLRRYPVYLQAMRRRREQLGAGGAAVYRDRERLDRVQPLQDAYLQQVAALPEGRPPSAALRTVRWMLEEYRVSLWAPELGTAGKVSDVRIRKALG
jgi:ATP-dependent helicase HrpA